MLLRLIGKWLNAGVLEDGCVTHPDEGSPQGGVVSPILSNLTGRTPNDGNPRRNFDLLGFTHYWARSRDARPWVVTTQDVHEVDFVRAATQALSRWCQINRHRPLATQHQTLSQKTDGALRVLRHHLVTPVGWGDSEVLPKEYGGTGFLVANEAVGCLGLDSIACWSVYRFPRR